MRGCMQEILAEAGRSYGRSRCDGEKSRAAVYAQREPSWQRGAVKAAVARPKGRRGSALGRKPSDRGWSTGEPLEKGHAAVG